IRRVHAAALGMGDLEQWDTRSHDVLSVAAAIGVVARGDPGTPVPEVGFQTMDVGALDFCPSPNHLYQPDAEYGRQHSVDVRYRPHELPAVAFRHQNEIIRLQRHVAERHVDIGLAGSDAFDFYCERLQIAVLVEPDDRYTEHLGAALVGVARLDN